MKLAGKIISFLNINYIVFSNFGELGKILNLVDSILFLKIIYITLYNSGELDIITNSVGKILKNLV